MRSEDGPLDPKENRVERETTAEVHRKQKLEIVLAGLREDRSVRDVCRASSRSRKPFITSGVSSCSRPGPKGLPARRSAGEKGKDKRIAELERVLGRKTLEVEIAGKASRGWE